VPGSINYLGEKGNIGIPSHTDRILFCNKRGISNIDYKSIPNIIFSDHRTVQGCFEIEIIENNNGENKNMNPYINSNSYTYLNI
jgi:hypothetical protein